MKKSTIILLIGAFILCLGFVGVTGYYIGSKSSKSVQQTEPTVETATSNDALRDEIRAELKEEVKEEVRQELYDEVYEEAYNAAYTTIESELDAKINELQEEADKQAEEAAKEAEEQQQTTEAPKSSGGGNSNGNHQQSTQTTKEEPTTQAPAPKADPYINVHDVTASASGGTAAIEAALNSAVDSSSGTVTCNTSSITGIGTFPIYWTSSDGATATSYITITE